ncbi:hypothetical protein V6N11_008613 [Hibiscus sabdariffa]|uniref:Uncharacterized protein n=1 Tax=Hibiscus sabdariffa TaxID=183260 RepID=A0ABR2PNP6_9ROSI
MWPLGVSQDVMKSGLINRIRGRFWFGSPLFFTNALLEKDMCPIVQDFRELLALQYHHSRLFDDYYVQRGYLRLCCEKLAKEFVKACSRPLDTRQAAGVTSA